ncbi:MAG: type II toxin-antitoxin system death-on-curing family toxin [Variovorax sp.]|nr:type II toxin-antitoxin system death-on-curing family toxin [Variovorax sp.]
MTSWRRVDQATLVLLHDESLAEHGGAPGLRDEVLLRSALARPLNLVAYGEPDVAALAATYALGLAKNHPFVDGNKRAAFLALGLFLALNGWRLAVGQAEATLTMQDVAAGAMEEQRLAAWIREHFQPRGR